MGIDSEFVYNSQTFCSDSVLDQSGRTLASESTPQSTSTPTAGTSGDRRFILQVSAGAAITEIVDSNEEPLITFLGSKSLQTTYSSDSPSDYLTPLEDILLQPTLLAETTQGSTSTPSSITPKITVLSSPLLETGLDIQDDEGSDISSVIDTEVRNEADRFHDKFNATILTPVIS